MSEERCEPKQLGFSVSLYHSLIPVYCGVFIVIVFRGVKIGDDIAVYFIMVYNV